MIFSRRKPHESREPHQPSQSARQPGDLNFCAEDPGLTEAQVYWDPPELPRNPELPRSFRSTTCATYPCALMRQEAHWVPQSRRHTPDRALAAPERTGTGFHKRCAARRNRDAPPLTGPYGHGKVRQRRSESGAYLGPKLDLNSLNKVDTKKNLLSPVTHRHVLRPIPARNDSQPELDQLNFIEHHSLCPRNPGVTIRCHGRRVPWTVSAMDRERHGP